MDPTQSLCGGIGIILGALWNGPKRSTVALISCGPQARMDPQKRSLGTTPERSRMCSVQSGCVTSLVSRALKELKSCLSRSNTLYLLLPHANPLTYLSSLSNTLFQAEICLRPSPTLLGRPLRPGKSSLRTSRMLPTPFVYWQCLVRTVSASIPFQHLSSPYFASFSTTTRFSTVFEKTFPTISANSP